MKNIKLGDQVYEGVETVRLDTAEGGTVDFAPYQETFAAGRTAGYNAGKEAGLEEGYNTGREAGYEEGHAEGHEAGYGKGFDDGYKDGKEEATQDAFEAGREQGNQEGFEAGKLEGHEEGYEEGKEDGIQTEYDRFWDAYQYNGTRESYNQAFSGIGWTDETFKPKYPLENVTYAMSMFFQSYISKIDYISLAGPPANGPHWVRSSMFASCQAHTITIEFKGDFQDSGMFATSSLKNLTVLGTMGGTNVTFQQCPLTVESMKSVITHLKNYSGTDEAGTYKVTFSPSCWTNLESDGTTAPDGNTWRDYVETTLGWLT